MIFVLTLTAIAYLDRVCISTSAKDMMHDLSMDKVQMGYIFSAFTLAYALFEVPSGWLADRFGPRLMLTRIVVGWSLMTMATGLAWSFISLLMIRLLFGIGEAGMFPGLARVFARWLPAQHRGSAFGFSVMSAAIGGALTPPLVVYLLKVIHWRHTFFIFGLVGVVWAVAWYVWFRDDPHHHSSVSREELEAIGTEPPKPHPSVPWAKVIWNRNMAFICIMYFGAIYGWYFYLTWLPTYLQEARHFNITEAGWLSMLPMIGIGVGVFSGGWVSDWLRPWIGLRWGRRLPGLIGFPLAALMVLAAVKTLDPKTSAVLFGLAAGLAAFGVAPGWATCLDIGGEHSGVVSGAMNMFGNFGGALSPVVIGVCVQKYGSWDMPLLTLAAFYVMTALTWLIIDPERPIEEPPMPHGAPQVKL